MRALGEAGASAWTASPAASLNSALASDTAIQLGRDHHLTQRPGVWVRASLPPPAGVSGAGRAAKESNLYCEIAEGINSYR